MVKIFCAHNNKLFFFQKTKKNFITTFQFSSEEDLAVTFSKCFVQFKYQKGRILNIN